MSRIRFGIIGCGGISGAHMNSLSRIPEVEITAISDIKESNMDGLRKGFPYLLSSSEAFVDHKDMLDTSKLDAVEILTPHALHFEQAIECLDRGLHLLIEKPMVCTVKQAKELIAKTEEKNRVVLVSYQRHFGPQFRYIKRLIESNAIGDIQFISAMQCQEWMRLTEGKWRQDPRMSCGGQLLDSASHLLDVILWATSLQPSEVMAFSNNLGTLVDINSSVSIKFTNNAQANIGIIGNSPCWEENITIWGSKGVVFYKDGKIEHLLFDGDSKIVPLKMPRGTSPERNFVDVILGKDENQSPPKCGLKVIELTEAIWESAKTGKKIEILH